MNDLPPLEFDLTPTEKERCGAFTAWLMKQRKMANERDAKHYRVRDCGTLGGVVGHYEDQGWLP